MSIGMIAPNAQPFFSIAAKSTTLYVANAGGYIANVAPGDVNDLETAGCLAWAPPLQQSGIVNLWPANTNNLRKALSAIANGQAAAGPILTIGDSTTRNSVGATNQGVTWPAVLANLLTKAGVSTRTDSWFGCSNVGTLAAYTTFDARLVGGTGWTLGQRTAGGQYVKWPGSLTPTALAFTPANSYNQVDVYYLSNTGAQTLSVDRGGSAPTTGGSTLNTNAALAPHKATFSWNTIASGPFNLTPGSAGSAQAFILGVVCRDTTAAHLDIINMAWAGSNSADWVSTTLTPYDPIALIKLTTPTAAIIAHYVNDANVGISDGGSVAPTPLAAFSANVTTIAQAVQVTGDAILSDGPQSNPASYASVVTGQAYVSALNALSSSLNLPFWERQTVFGGFLASNALGLMQDDRHGNATFLGQDARTAAKMLLSF